MVQEETFGELLSPLRNEKEAYVSKGLYVVDIVWACTIVGAVLVVLYVGRNGGVGNLGVVLLLLVTNLNILLSRFAIFHSMNKRSEDACPAPRK